MSSLGYTNHIIGALDPIAFESFKSSCMRTIQASLHIRSAGGGFQTVWKTRILTVQKLLHKNFNVFISDADSIWMKYQDLEITVPQSIDAAFAYGLTFPRPVFDRVGFVVCAGVAGYRATTSSKRLFDRMVGRCGEQCDDQGLLNHILMGRYEMDWRVKNCSGATPRIKPWLANAPVGLSTLYNQQACNSSHLGFSQIYINDFRMKSKLKRTEVELTAMVFPDDFILRGPHFSKRGCAGVKNAWIISPNVPKTVNAKIQLYKKYEKCIGVDVEYIDSVSRRVDSEVMSNETMTESVCEQECMKDAVNKLPKHFFKESQRHSIQINEEGLAELDMYVHATLLVYLLYESF